MTSFHPMLDQQVMTQTHTHRYMYVCICVCHDLLVQHGMEGCHMCRYVIHFVINISLNINIYIYIYIYIYVAYQIRPRSFGGSPVLSNPQLSRGNKTLSPSKWWVFPVSIGFAFTMFLLTTRRTISASRPERRKRNYQRTLHIPSHWNVWTLRLIL